jgi:hypothetical protein
MSKEKSTSKLLDIAKHYANKKKKSVKDENKLNQAVQLLNVRKLNQDENSKLYKIKSNADLENCICDSHNSAEVVGISSSILIPKSKEFLSEFKKSYQDKFIRIHHHDKECEHGEREHKFHIYGRVIRSLFKKWEESKKQIDFDTYLERYASDRSKIKILKKAVVYFSPSEAEEYKVKFHKGKVYQRDEVIPSGRYMFVLDQTGNHLFVGKKKKGTYHHTSFVRGDPTACAGFITIKNGYIVEVRGHSGHYKPTEVHLQRMKDYLFHPLRMGENANNIIMSLYTGKII